MISKDIDAVDLQDYYTQLYNLQAEHHRPDYMLVHDEIRLRLKDCASYTEFGVNQGTTLAIAFLEKTPKIRAYDHKLLAYGKAAHHFEAHAKEFNLDFAISEADTLKCTIEPCDLLYIDTYHVYEHLTKELLRHGDRPQKYMVFHDTQANGAQLKKAVKEFVTRNKQWKIITDCDINVGFMTISRD